MRNFVKIAALSAALLATSAASAATIVVDAQANSSGGTGVARATGIFLNAGQRFTVSSDTLNDLWSAGALPRWSDANGLVDRLANGTDDSGEAAGTQIGVSSFGTLTLDGHTARFGALVGRIGGVYQTLGANFDGFATGSGELELFYWDSNNFDNEDFITFQISAVPEPATWGMMLVGFGLIGRAMRGGRRAVPRLRVA